MQEKNKTVFTKIVYFDEKTAQDYLDITNGGRFDWNKKENKERLAKILAELEAKAQGKFNILSFLGVGGSSEISASAKKEFSKIIDTTLHNTVLTDYIAEASKDKNVVKLGKDSVYAPANSVSMYKMVSSYLTIVPKDQMPIDMEKLNEAVLERGYYGMLLKSEEPAAHFLRFNIEAFKNNYTLADLSKMSLMFYGVKVGSCTMDELTIDKEFLLQKKQPRVSADEIVNGKKAENHFRNLEVIDVVLAGITNEEN